MHIYRVVLGECKVADEEGYEESRSDKFKESHVGGFLSGGERTSYVLE